MQVFKASRIGGGRLATCLLLLAIRLSEDNWHPSLARTSNPMPETDYINIFQMILIIPSEYRLSFKLTNSDKIPHYGLLSEADSCPKPDNIDSDKSPLRTRDLESSY